MNCSRKINSPPGTSAASDDVSDSNSQDDKSKGKGGEQGDSGGNEVDASNISSVLTITLFLWKTQQQNAKPNDQFVIQTQQGHAKKQRKTQE